MRRLESQGVTFNACEGCGGVFTNPGRFNMLLRQPSQQLETGVLKRLDRLASGSGARPALIPSCPECSVAMVLSSLGTLSPRPIPSCPRCFALFLSRDLVREILLRKRPGPDGHRAPGAREVSCETALRQGLEDLLKRSSLRHNWRGVLGFSPSTGRSYHALRFETTGQSVILLLPEKPEGAAAVAALPIDIRWEL
jgi:Zn-finger nucleic acid-binding protein